MERLNYNGTRKLPEIFTEQEVMQIVLQPLKSQDYWTKDGYADWGEFFRMRDVCLLATIYLLGLRPKEACCLRFDDFDFRSGNVKIRASSNKVRKERVLPIPATLMKFYRKYLTFPKARFWKGSKFLFPSFGSEHLSASALKTIMREKILKPLNLWEMPVNSKKSKFSTYTLRHSRASHLLNKQIQESGQPDIYAIANILGHSDIRSTTVYLHTDKKYQDYLRELMS